MNSSLPSSICGSASDSSYANTDQSSIRSAGHTSIASTSTSSKPKRTVRFQDPEPVSDLADSVSFHPGPNLSLSSLDLSDDNSSYSRHSRQSSSAASSIRAGKQPMRNASPASSRFGRHLTVGRPPLIRDHSVSSTASAPGDLEFTDWLARMEEMKARPGSALSDRRASPRGAKGASTGDAEKEERKKKRRSWVNLLVR